MVSGHGRILAVDPGSVRLGLAISDVDRRLASPLTTYTRRDAAQDAAYFKRIVSEEEVGLLVVGLPIHEDGSEGGQAKAARAFGAWLGDVTGVSVVFYDERFTSFEADNALADIGLTKKQRKARRDRVAAQILLQTYLDTEVPRAKTCQPDAPATDSATRPTS
ncbi:MAG: Holliday junction resolvase RuvX [Planctomycetes bacterium]|nr:Holliday junction resolvase RuvX [Planctomycetota bacterium]